ncbi:uncharacterized protein AMSG_03829 [Thecamonas trahens ATCC 50062]|uniref:Uncharacterized protein n=1 Tax=Thecamonas trahens ATCC 50062 TaxID=461836 RepID=A0A0L0D5B5_THETB|nr:hypothetical protein AMSG_03829 [Thecamonas trahens ATCC 50062]KNC47395.1 hypothetical protein AMSG_03829 [Thecamonas trahens ATCC 50062]|eukprot:XP_013759733.1 hypothetical protein AMSG_03829 [Thecamonas trahens ATCC 50062]
MRLRHKHSSSRLHEIRTDAESGPLGAESLSSSSELSHDILLVNEKADFDEIMRNMPWIAAYQAVLMTLGMDQAAGKRRSVITTFRSLMLSLLLFSVSLVAFYNATRNERWTMLTLIGLWYFHCGVFLGVMTLHMPSRWFRHLIVSLVVHAADDPLVSLSSESDGGRGSRSRSEAVRQRAHADILPTHFLKILNHGFRYLMIAQLVAITFNVSIGAAFFIDIGTATDVYISIIQPFDSLGFKIFAFFSNTVATVVWIFPLPPFLLSLYILHKQFAHLADAIRRGAIPLPEDMAVTHQRIHRRSVFLTHFARWPIGLNISSHAVFSVFLSYRIVTQDSADMELLVIEMFWLLAATLVIFVITFLAAYVHSSGSEAMVFAIADVHAPTFDMRTELEYALSTVERRASGFRLAKTFLITWTVLAKIVSLFVSFLALLNNMQSVPELASTRVLFADYKYTFVCGECVGTEVGHARFERLPRAVIDMAFVALFNMHMVAGHAGQLDAEAAEQGDALSEAESFTFADIDAFVRSHWFFLTAEPLIDDTLSSTLFTTLLKHPELFRKLEPQPDVLEVAERAAPPARNGKRTEVVSSVDARFQLTRFHPYWASSLDALAARYPHLTHVEERPELVQLAVESFGEPPAARRPSASGLVAPRALSWTSARAGQVHSYLDFVSGLSHSAVAARRRSSRSSAGSLTRALHPAAGVTPPRSPAPKKRGRPRKSQSRNAGDKAPKKRKPRGTVPEGEVQHTKSHPLGSIIFGVKAIINGFECVGCGYVSRWACNVKRHIKTATCGIELGLIDSATREANRKKYSGKSASSRAKSAKTSAGPPRKKAKNNAGKPTPPPPPPPTATVAATASVDAESETLSSCSSISSDSDLSSSSSLISSSSLTSSLTSSVSLAKPPPTSVPTVAASSPPSATPAAPPAPPPTSRSGRRRKVPAKLREVALSDFETSQLYPQSLLAAAVSSAAVNSPSSPSPSPVQPRASPLSIRLPSTASSAHAASPLPKIKIRMSREQ